jgi:hypothetical protein
MAVVIHPTYFSLFPRLKIKLRDRNFDTIEVNEAEQQAGLNTITEHDFQDAFNKWQRRNSAYVQMGTTSRVRVASSPKVSV